jgi:hypothetical protein
VPVLVNTHSGTSALAGKTVVAIAAGTWHSLALCSDGTIAAWGWNGDGQLGDNSTTQRNVPVLVNTNSGTSALAGKTVVAITAGQYHSLALCADGTLASWGYNGNGQLGDNSTIRRPFPVAVHQRDVLADKTFIAIASGSQHNLALCSDGTVASWGLNGNGQLGDQSFTDRIIPTAVYQSSVLVGNAVVAITAGQYHSLALCSNGTLAAWGRNGDGQLGDNSASNQPTPVAVTQNGLLAGNRFLALARPSSMADHSLALYPATSEIAVAQPATTNLIDGSANRSFGIAALAGVPNERTFTIRNTGRGDLYLPGITFDGADAGDFIVTRNPAMQVLSGRSSTFTVRFKPATPGAKTAVMRIANNDGNESPFDITLNGTGIPGAYLRLGDTLNFDLSWVPLNSGETLRVLGLPPGLVFTAGSPPTITGTAFGPAPVGGVTLQVLDGKRVVQSIPLELVIESAHPSGIYELLLEENGQPTGKLRLTVANPTKASPNPSFTATLVRLGEPTRSTKGSFPAVASPQTVPVVFPFFKTYPAITFDVVLTTGSDLVTAATSPTSGLTARGFRLARSSRVPIGNPALTLTLLPTTSGDRTTTPGGIGHAKGTVTSAALVSLSGQLGDAQPFTTSLSLSQTNQAIVWLTPYTNKQSYLGGIIGIADTGAADRGASANVARTGLRWKKQADPRAAAYPGGFGPLAMSAKCSRWVATPKAEGLAQSLGLDFRALAVTYIAPTAEVLPTRLSLRDNLALLPIAPDGAVPFNGKAAPATGTFVGSLKLPAPAARSLISGVFLQDDIHSPLIGQGLVRIPITGGVKGSFQTVGVEFRSLAGLGTHRYRIGDSVNIDLSAITLAPGESLRVVGLPPGLELVGSLITGTVTGLGSSSGVQIQVLKGRIVIETFPLDLAIEPYLFAGSYELLLEEAGLPIGKLKVTLTASTAKEPFPAFTATLDRLGHPRRSAKGIYAASASPQTLPLIFPLYKSHPAVGYVVTLSAGSNLVTGKSPGSSVTARGFRLARLGHIPTNNSALTMSFPPAVPGDRTTTPGGFGYATGTFNSQALVPLSGILGDAQAFTTSLNLSQTNQAVFWITPYKNKSSYLGGIVTLPSPATPDRGAVLERITAGLKWTRALDATAPSYPNGFSAQSLTARSSRWLLATTAVGFADSLGLTFRGINVSYKAPTADILPTFWSLRDNFSLNATFPSNAVSFTGKALRTNGTFTGTLTLPAPADKSAMSGVFLQDAAFGQSIGQGLIKVPIPAMVKGSFQTFGVELGN